MAYGRFSDDNTAPSYTINISAGLLLPKTPVAHAWPQVSLAIKGLASRLSFHLAGLPAGWHGNLRVEVYHTFLVWNCGPTLDERNLRCDHNKYLNAIINITLTNIKYIIWKVQWFFKLWISECSIYNWIYVLYFVGNYWKVFYIHQE